MKALQNKPDATDTFIVVLEEEQGTRRIAIEIGKMEAQAIATHYNNVELIRPLTHDLLKQSLEKLNTVLNQVVIYDIVDEILLARIVLGTENGEEINIEARSSDAIALAVRYNCPILIEENIMNRHDLRMDVHNVSQTEDYAPLIDYTVPELEKLLEKIIAEEKFEKASQIRDLIKRKKL